MSTILVRIISTTVIFQYYYTTSTKEQNYKLTNVQRLPFKFKKKKIKYCLKNFIPFFCFAKRICNKKKRRSNLNEKQNS